MSKLVLRFLTVFAIALGPATPMQAGQRTPDIGGILGNILNSALANQSRREWQYLSAAENNCLETHNTSAHQLASDGIDPNDSRVQRMFAQCARDSANKPPIPSTANVPSGPYNPDFVVDGLAVGASVYPESSAYKAYRCHASVEFPGFTWCSLKRTLSSKFGRYDSWVTILHSSTNIVASVNQDVTPAYFAPNEADHEIQRLSQHFGQSARIYNGEPRPDAPHSVIATWGDVTLTPLDQPTMDALSRGDTVTAGLLIDFLGELRKSVREGLPVFHIGGGGGYIWAAKFDDKGKGRLQLTAVNTTLLPERSVTSYAPMSAPSPATTVPDPAQSEKERAAHAEKAISAANAQLEDVGSFIKEHPKSPKLLDYIDRISKLTAAVRAGDAEEIERRLTDLNDSLSHDDDYGQHLKQQAQAQKKRAAQFLVDAIHRGEQERDFILEYIGNNPLAEVTPAFAAYVKKLNPALQQADLTELQPLVDKVDLAIREANLEPAFIAAQKEAPNSSEKKAEATIATSANAEPTNSQAARLEPTKNLPITEKNRFLVAGDLEDVEILYNASSHAPHVAQNLRGDFVFAQNQARICLFGQNPDDLALIVEQAVAAKVDPTKLAMEFEPCNPDQLLSYDIVATQRNGFLRVKKEDALTLTKHIEQDDYRIFGEVTAANLNKAVDAERAQIEKIKVNITDGAPDGFGIIILKTGSPNLCIAAGDRTPSHRQLLLGSEGKINLEMQTKVIVKDTTIEDAFINVQKNQCGAVYASATDLKALTAALARNNTQFAFSSVWNLPADVERENALLAQKAKVAAEQEVERRQRNADETQLASIRAKNLSDTQAAQQAALRKKFGDTAQAASGSFSSEIITWTKDQSGQLGAFYPAFATWLADKLADRWEIVTIDSDVQDFGTSNFKTRALDTVFSRITLHLQNRMLGEHKDSCFIFGRMNDTEFSMSREPVFVQCDDEAAVKAWQSAHQFESEWFASNSTAPKGDEMGANTSPPTEAASEAPTSQTTGKMKRESADKTAKTPPEDRLPADVDEKSRNDDTAAVAPADMAKAIVRKPLTIEDLPQYKFARSVEQAPVAGGNAESRYLTTIYGIIKTKLRATPELHLEMATQHGVVDFYVDEGGDLVGRKLASSSGSPNLDTAVMAAIAEAAPYPAPPHGQPVSLNYNFGRTVKPIDNSVAAEPFIPSATATSSAVGPAQ
jgi:TonB family protein